jgi:diguanylate cyclase (GGDEF)-like protein
LGGDEFGVVLSLKGQSVEESAAIEQQFSQVVQAVAASESSALKTSTLSCGIALDFCGTQTARELLGQADQLLYRSKVAGKNRVARSE